MLLLDPYRFAAAPTDPNYASVSLLLHGDGTDGSTIITDSSPSPKTVTVVGNAKVSTAQSKFGGASIELDGSGDWLSVPSISLSGAFTLETFVRWKSLKTYGLIAVGTGANTQLFFGLKDNQTGLRWGRTGVAEHGTASFSWSLNTWYHVALVRNTSNEFKCFVDGVNATDSTPSDSFAYSGTLEIGGSGGISAEPNAFFDEYRITAGIARYTANFTPPTAPFPDA